MADFLCEFKENELKGCIQNEPPFCAAACPFGLAVKDFIEKIRRGGFNAAYRLYQNSVGFPAIVAAICDQPCQAHCSRTTKGGAIALRELERATLRLTRKREPNSYNLPAKGKTIAIVGAGLSGLGCALRLAARNYQVTVYEKTDRLGGQLWEIMKPEIFLSDFERQFQHSAYTLELEHEIRSLAELEDADAIYVATGAAGRSFGLYANSRGAFASQLSGVFFGGSLQGRTTMEALADGLLAADALERYLKTGYMNQPEQTHDTKIKMDLTSVEPVDTVAIPAVGYDREAALAEAQRCLQCSCNACVHTCDLMRITGKFPNRIWEEVQITIHPGTLDKDGTWATRLIATCNQCGLCKSTCPQRIDVGRFLQNSHRAMHNKGAMPWAFHDFWLRDLEFTNGPEAQLCRAPQDSDRCDYLFFPGCQLGASRPEYVMGSYRWLLSQYPKTGILLHCCGAPAHWAGNEALMREETDKLRAQWQALAQPTVVYACPTCRQMFGLYLPEITLISLYELMAQSDLQPTDQQSGTVCVFDPCNSRDFPALQEGVRTLTGRTGLTQEPLPHERALAQCCSYGGQVSIAAPSYARRVIQDRAAQNGNPYVAYCVNCRDNFISEGKPVYHILDLLFSLEAETELPTATARRENRRQLKRQLLAEFWGETMPQTEAPIQLHIPDELKVKLGQFRILEEEVAEVVRHCEATGQKLYQPDTESYAGHLKIGNMTFWASYRPIEDGYLLLNAYAHRMNLAGE